MVEFKRPRVRSLQIETHFGGFSAHCGCANKIYADVEEMIKDITEYLRDPDSVEEQWRQANRKRPLIDEGAGESLGPQRGMGPTQEVANIERRR